MKRTLHVVILVLGFAALILAASASDSGADLLYTVPAGLCGCGLMIFGVHGCRAQK